MKRFCLVVVLLICLNSFAFSQRQTGSIAGIITDENDYPLPGVSVTLTGPVVQGSLTFITTDTGAYRFPTLLPGGDYVITCELPGFKTTIQKGLTVSAGRTLTINIVLPIADIEEEVVVIAGSPTVDLKATQTSFAITKALIDSMPIDRDVFAVVGAAPGTIEAGRYAVSQGSDLYQTKHSLDGVAINDPSSHFPLMKISPDMVEEIEISLGGHQAEVGAVAGSNINIISSVGGNEFRGNAVAHFFSESFVDRNFSQEQLDSLGVGKPSTEKRTQDFSLSLAGPIKIDKIWFFTSARFQGAVSRALGYPEDSNRTERELFAKSNISISDRLSLMLAAHHHYYYFDSADASRWFDPSAVAQNPQNTITLNSRLNWILSPNAFLDFRALQIKRTHSWLNVPGYTNNNYDRGTGMYSGAGINQETYKRHRPLVLQQSLTLFQDSLIGGSHEFKTGLEFEWTHEGRYSFNETPIRTYTWFGSPYYYGGNEGRFIAYGWPEEEGSYEQQNKGLKIGFYIQDSFSIKNRLTLNIGVRYDSQRSWLPAQHSPEVPYWLWLEPDFFSRKDYPERKNVVVWNSFTPRFGLIYDLLGDGKTTIKASYSQYHVNLIDWFWSGVNPNRSSTFIDYFWIDTNWNGIIDPEDTFIETRRSGRGDWDPRDNIDPDFRSPISHEYRLGLEREIIADFRLGATLIYKNQGNLNKTVERDGDQNWSKTFTVIDPGYDGIFGTSDDRELTIYDRTAPFVDNYYTNLEEAWRKYRGLEFLIEKRMSNNWQLLGSITWSRSWGTSDLLRSGAEGLDFATPNALINNEGRLDLDLPLVVKMQFAFVLPYKITLGGYFNHSSGNTYTRQVRVYAPGARSFVTVYAEQKGTRRQPSSNRLDLRIDREIMTKNISLRPFLEIYNAFNSAYVNISGQTHGDITAVGSFVKNPSWLAITSTSIPRILKLGLRIGF